MNTDDFFSFCLEFRQWAEAEALLVPEKDRKAVLHGLIWGLQPHILRLLAGGKF